MSHLDPQLKSNDCGISAIKTICNLLDRPIDRAYIQQHIHLDQQGSRMSDIKTFLDTHQFTARFQLLDVNHLHSDVSAIAHLCPFIVPIEHKQALHYVVISGIKGCKLRVLDPAKGQPYYLTLQELKKIAHFSSSYWDMVAMEQKLAMLCTEELTTYAIPLEQALSVHDYSSLFNKLTYFSYLKDNFGFKNETAEKAFLTDLLFNQQINTVPRHFRTLKYEHNKIKIKSPLILSVQVDKNTYSSPPKPAAPSTNPYLSLLQSLGTQRKMWHIYVVAALFSSFVTQFGVFTNQILIDHILPAYQIQTLIVFVIGLGVFKLFDLCTSLYKSFVGIHVGNLLDRYFLGSFDEKLNTYSLPYIQSFKRGDLSERLSDVLKLKAFFLRFFTRIIVDICIAAYSIAVLFFIHWKLTLVVCGVMVLFYGWFRIITPYLKQNERIRFVRKADFFSRMIEKLDGLQVLKSFRAEKNYSYKLAHTITDLLSIQVRSRYIDMLNSLVVASITIGASLLILFVLSRNAIQEATVTLGQLVTFIALTDRVFSSLRGILEENLTLQENEVILSRYMDFKDTIPVPSTHTIHEFTIQKLVFTDLSFGYFPNEPILKNIHFNLHAGEKIRIEGHNGSGKSTLSRLLTSLYKPSSGHIQINDYEHIFYDPDRIQEKIVLVSNEDILFNDTLMSNITFGREVSTHKILEVARKIGFYDFIASKEEGLAFMVNENGRNLSTGQRKKILLLRGLFSKAEILILDEVLSGIDANTRTQVELFLNQQTDKSLIIVSHEPITHIHFHKQYILDHGKLDVVY